VGLLFEILVFSAVYRSEIFINEVGFSMHGINL